MNFYYASPSETRLPAQPAVAIRDGAAAPPPAASPGTPSYVRPYANAARNSRVALRTPAQPLAVRWQSELYPQFAPQFVLTGGKSIVAAGMDSWRVLDDSGKTTGEDRRASGDIVVDPGPGIFYFADTIGRVAAHHLSDASKAFSLSVFFGSEFRRDFIERNGRRVLVLSVERETDAHGGNKPRLSVIELQQFGDSFVFSETKRMKSATRFNYLNRESVNLLTATEGETIALAAENSLYYADRDLKLQREFTGEFVPQQLSLDEQSRMHLIVKTGETLGLWVVGANGQRVVKQALPADFEPIAPPVIGHNHTIYVVSAQRILAFTAGGKEAWNREFPSGVAGAVATADDQLLVTSGSQLLAVDASGNATAVFTAENDRLLTPAAPTASGDIVIAGERQVYCLRAK